MPIDVRLLGPVEIHAGDQLVPVGAPQRRALLAAIAVDAGRVVSRERLIDRVWDFPPARVEAAIHVHITHLRRVLAEASGVAGRTPPATLERRAGGYVLGIDGEEVDLFRFRRLVAAARQSGAAAGEQVRLLDEALALWRGPAMAGVTGGWSDRMRQSWSQERVGAVVSWASALLDTGETTRVLTVAGELSAEHPLDEPLTSVLMRALALAGRPAEALDRYTHLRQRLADELGTLPGAQLQALHQAILRGDVSRPPPVTVPLGPAPTGVVPAQLPADVADFVGRSAELAELDALLSNESDRTAVVISAVSGTAGVGKTALAVHWAHRARDRFPDGQLYLNLSGYDPAEPMKPGDALTAFLVGLGVPDHEIPLDVEARAARFRTETAKRRMLIVLDNAGSVAQVRPLLPGGPMCAVMVTSRDSLAGLVAVNGARRVDLDLLPAADALALLRGLVGRRVDDEPEAAGALAERCARLPLALRIAAELAASRPQSRLADLVADLADEQHSLDILRIDSDPRSTVTTVFSWSLRQLPAEVGRAFRRLGLHPGPDFDAHAAAALIGSDLPEAAGVLDQLARAHLVSATRRGRYAMHDLLRAYALMLSTEDGESVRQAALCRLYDFYLAASAAAMDQLYPARKHQRPRIPSPAAPLPAFPDRGTAGDWLDAERAVLVAIAAQVGSRGSPTHTIRLSITLFRYLDGTHLLDARAVHSHAVEAARGIGDRAGEAYTLLNLAEAESLLGRQDVAAGYVRQGLDLYQRLGDEAGQGRAFGGLGNIEGRQGRYDESREYFQQAVTHYRLAGDAAGEATHLVGLALTEDRLGRLEAATGLYREALRMSRQAHDEYAEAWSLANLGDLEARMDCHVPAVAHLEEALSLFHKLSNPFGQVHVLIGLAITNLRLGRPADAGEQLIQAMDVNQQIGNRIGEADILNGLGEVGLAQNRPDEAVSRHLAALARSTESGDRDQQARAHHGLGRAYAAGGEQALATESYERALIEYLAIGSPRAEVVREEIADLEQPTRLRR